MKDLSPGNHCVPGDLCLIGGYGLAFMVSLAILRLEKTNL